MSSAGDPAELTAQQVRDLLCGGRPVDQDLLIDALDRLGTPLITADPEHPGNRRLLFAWIEEPGEEPLAGVYLWANRLTDKHRMARGELHRVPGTRIWCVELTEPAGVMSGYRMYPYRPGDPALTEDGLQYTRELVRDALVDPHNRLAAGGSPFGSVLHGDDAPDMTLWHSAGEPDERTVSATTIDVDGRQVPCRLSMPAVDGPPPALLVVYDAEKWLGRYGLGRVLDAAYRSGRSRRRYAIAGIDSPSRPPERLALLGGNPHLADAVAEQLIPAARAALGGAPEQVIAVGQSLGGIAALTLAARRPGLIDEVLVYSPSVWWRPGLTGRAADVGQREEWVHDLLRGQDEPSFRIRLAVGDYEGPLIARVLDLADTAREVGHPVQLDRYSGGHDDYSWAAVLSTHLD